MNMSLAQEATLPRTRIDADYTAKSCVSAEGFSAVINDYARHSQAALATPGSQRDLVYDADSGMKLDLYGADVATPRPVFLFIHGGYWRALSKDVSAFMAPMLAAHGIATAVPDYTLAPSASLAEITRQMRASLAYLWNKAERLGIDRQRIVVGGSSAGGHLASMLAMRGWQAGFGLPENALHGALPVSGLFELAPIAASHVQDWMQLSANDVQILSPMRHLAGTCRSHIAMAETEAAGFHRQSFAYAAGLGAPLLTVAGRNHFDVILDLMQPETSLSQALFGLFNA